MLNPEKAQSCLETIFAHACHLIKYVTVSVLYIIYSIFKYVVY